MGQSWFLPQELLKYCGWKLRKKGDTLFMKAEEKLRRFQK